MNEIGLQNVLNLQNMVQKVDLKYLNNDGQKSINRVGKLGGDVTISNVNNSGFGSVNEIGIMLI